MIHSYFSQSLAMVSLGILSASVLAAHCDSKPSGNPAPTEAAAGSNLNGVAKAGAEAAAGGGALPGIAKPHDDAAATGAPAGGPAPGTSNADKPAAEKGQVVASGASFCDVEIEAGKAKKLPWPPPDVALAPPLPPSGRKGAVWVNFWASWCGPCREEIPKLMEWSKAWGVQMVFISMDDQKDDWLRAADELEMAHLKMPMSQGFGATPGGKKWASAAGLEEALPVHAIFDGAGRLRCTRKGSIGDVDEASFRAYLLSLR